MLLTYVSCVSLATKGRKYVDTTEDRTHNHTVGTHTPPPIQSSKIAKITGFRLLNSPPEGLPVQAT